MKVPPAAIILLFTLTVAFAETGNRHVEEQGGFSFCAPAGWEFNEYPGMKYKIAFGIPTDEFRPNINIVDEKFNGSLKEYVDNNIKALRQLLQGCTVVSTKEFKTSAGLKGHVLVLNATQYGHLLRQSFLFVKGSKGRFIVMTCSCLEKDGDSFSPVFEESMKTLQVD